jgi:hypothetical protein
MGESLTCEATPASTWYSSGTTSVPTFWFSAWRLRYLRKKLSSSPAKARRGWRSVVVLVCGDFLDATLTASAALLNNKLLRVRGDAAAPAGLQTSANAILFEARSTDVAVAKHVVPRMQRKNLVRTSVSTPLIGCVSQTTEDILVRPFTCEMNRRALIAQHAQRTSESSAGRHGLRGCLSHSLAVQMFPLR